jgi:hypothetical protein
MLFASLCATAAAPPGGGRAALPALGDRLSAIIALGPRAEGSPEEAAAFDYIEGSLRASGLSPERSGFADADDGYSASRIVQAIVRGSRDDELAVLVPVGSWADSTDPSEGAYGIAIALDEASRLASRIGPGRNAVTIRFVFLGAERRGRASSGELASLGSKTWIARQSSRTALAVLYLSMDAPPARIALRSAGPGLLSPFWYFESVKRALGSSGMEFDLDANRLQAYRLGLASDYGPSAPYLQAGIPAVELRGLGLGGPGEAAGWLDSFISAFSSGFGAGASGGFPDSWDRHYFIVPLGKADIVVREKSYIIFLVAIVAVIATSLLAATVARRSQAKLILRRAPAIVVQVLALSAALALVFLAGRAMSLLDARVLGSAEAWKLAPRLFAGARILFCFLLFLSILSILVERRVLTPNPYFYEFAALICLGIDILAFSAIDLSASFYFVWAFLVVELSLILRKRWATLIAYALMYLPLLAIAWELAARPDLAAYGRLIAPGGVGALALSALTLPFFMFTASPLLFYAKSGVAARKRAAAVLAAAALAIEAAAMVACWARSPIEGPGRRDLSVSESIDQDSGRFIIELSGKRRLGRGTLLRAEQRLGYDSSGDRASLAGMADERRLALSASAAPFLDRVDENLRIAFSSRPYSIELKLESEDELLIYDCSLPYKVSVDGLSAAIFAGVNPGEELRFSITAPAAFKARLVATAHYLDSPGRFAQSSGSPLSVSDLSARASLMIGGGAE